MVKYTIGDALLAGIALLKENKIESAGEDARVIMAHCLGHDKLYITVHRDDILGDEEKKIFFSAVQRRAKNEPVAYITHSREFMSLDFYVDENVLVPRPDTEILVEKIIELCGGGKTRIFDICTGSGAIAVSLAKYMPECRVCGLDISATAVKIARKNAVANGVDDRCEFKVADALCLPEFSADCIVSNPPYVSAAEMTALMPDVSDFEPHIALYGGDDGLTFYRSISQNAPSRLSDGGILAFEVGFTQSKDVSDIMSCAGFKNIQTVRDLSGTERVVFGFKI